MIELKQLTKRIWYTTPERETDRPVLGYIKGDRYSLAVDAGNSKEHVKDFVELLAQQDLKEAEYVAITHWHWDHTFGMWAVNGTTITGSKTNEELKKVQQWEWSEEAMAARLVTGEDIEMCDTCIRVEYPDRSKIRVETADLVFTSRLSVDLGGITCELMEVDSPHSDDAVLIYVPEEKTLFVGDSYGEDFYYNEGRYEKEKLARFMKLLETIDFEHCVVGHCDPETRTSLFEYLQEEYDKITE